MDSLCIHLNTLTESECESTLMKCCGSRAWAATMARARPFSDRLSLNAKADHSWWSLMRSDWLEAFSHHPEIGADKEQLRAKFAETQKWAAGEQAGMTGASESTLSALAKGNQDYKAKFGYLFLVCATGKTADEMLVLLQTRLANDLENELFKAAAEQAKITQIRLNKLGENP
jgi:2-oxo-4-hydroxy-4-carboxy-5-ureidoimidazoline decarboxylase